MSGKTTRVIVGNAAERLKSSRAMPSLMLSEPLPPEDAPAVAVKPRARVAEARRTFRISTYLTEEAGARLTRMVAEIKRTEGRRHGAPDIIERALLALERAERTSKTRTTE